MAAATACIRNVKALLPRGGCVEGRLCSVSVRSFCTGSSFKPVLSTNVQRRIVSPRVQASPDHTSPVSENHGALELSDGIVDSVSVAAVVPPAVDSGVPKSPLKSFLHRTPEQEKRRQEERKQSALSQVEVFIERVRRCPRVPSLLHAPLSFFLPPFLAVSFFEVVGQG